MNILYVNETDLSGRRFNGHDMQLALNRDGVSAYQIVLEKYGRDKHTVSLMNSDAWYVRQRAIALDDKLALRSVSQPFGWALMEHELFKAADIVHYHLIYNNMIALPMLPELTKLKPSLLTVHDHFLTTGHCIYPVSQCNKWLTGCGDCPSLDTPFKVTRDNTALAWQMKKDIFSRCELELIVASEYMKSFVERSPITSRFKTHFIPFGIDIDQFEERGHKDARKKLGIPENKFVIFCRANFEPFKGTKFIADMLKNWNDEIVPFIVTVDNWDIISDWHGGVKDFGWVSNDVLRDLFSACDLFLMPSTDESFGLMAIEAMTASRPIVVTEDTALPEVTFAPLCGVVIPQNADALRTAVVRLMHNPEELERRGKLGRELAEKHYKFEMYYQKHKLLYESIYDRGEV
ncbi:glycosyl transferase [Synergistales bacterium]|nr:glycosyl transferase [Synergistales bacterium]